MLDEIIQSATRLDDDIYLSSFESSKRFARFERSSFFDEERGGKKREWKTDKVAQKIKKNLLVFLRRNQENIHQTFWQ